MIAPELLRVLKQYVPYISAVILVIVVYAMPKGLAGLPELVSSWYADLKKNKKTINARSN
jgi:hypothetical protein